MAQKLRKAYTEAKKKRNKGVHSKNKHSKSKTSTHYKKKYRGQGKRH